MRKVGSTSGTSITIDENGEAAPIRRTASQPLDNHDVLEIEREDGPAVQEQGE